MTKLQEGPYIDLLNYTEVKERSLMDWPLYTSLELLHALLPVNMDFPPNIQQFCSKQYW
jgi:hypothetical protein